MDLLSHRSEGAADVLRQLCPDQRRMERMEGRRLPDGVLDLQSL